jgi:hypothetical protein
MKNAGAALGCCRCLYDRGVDSESQMSGLSAREDQFGGCTDQRTIARAGGGPEVEDMPLVLIDVLNQSGPSMRVKGSFFVFKVEISSCGETMIPKARHIT